MAEKLVSWAIFSVVVALIPIFFNALRLHSRPGGPGPHTILDRGELLILTAALCAAAVGELLISPQVDGVVRVSKLVAGGAVILILLFSSLYYADVNAAHVAGARQNLKVVRTSSLVFFSVAFFACGSCVLLAQITP